jgi:hypothetical protein
MLSSTNSRFPNTSSRAVPGGFMITHFFRMPAQVTGLDIGLSSGTVSQGASIGPALSLRKSTLSALLKTYRSKNVSRTICPPVLS